MAIRTIAHLSDLHIGKSGNDRVAVALCDTLRAHHVDHVVVTGDITEHGRVEEVECFTCIFETFLSDGRLTVVPGNHDRHGDEIAKRIMHGTRVDTVRANGLHLVRVDSTGPHNRYRMMSHGKIDEHIIQETESAIHNAEPSDLVVVILHHHLLPLPEDLFMEKVANWLHLSFAKELLHGRLLLERLKGHCDLVLHGHRHASMEWLFTQNGRDLGLYNAGSSTHLGKFRVFSHENGRLVGPPKWISS